MNKSLLNIQTRLKELGYYTSTLDGEWGPNSQQALRQAITDGKTKLSFDFISFKSLFQKASLTQDFVNDINIIFDRFNNYNNIDATNPLYVGYMLATAWHETGFRMTPIKELGGDKYLSKYDTGHLAAMLGNSPQADGDGQKFAGRGLSMITGKTNYLKFSKLLNQDLVTNPDLVLDETVSADILILGSMKGLFTGVSLPKCIKTGSTQEFVKARSVINGSDKASAIAQYALKFVSCITIV